VSGIDIAVVDSLKALDPKRPIREADIIASARLLYFGRHSTLKAMMIWAGSALRMLFKSSKPLFSLAPASFKLPSSVDLAALETTRYWPRVEHNADHYQKSDPDQTGR
jgi:hypothetical protein